MNVQIKSKPELFKLVPPWALIYFKVRDPIEQFSI